MEIILTKRDLGSSFLAQSESALINFSAEELDYLILKIKDIRRKIRVNNPNPSVDDMRRRPAQCCEQ